MEKTITHDFLVVMNKLRKLTNKHHHPHKDMVHHGEFMMLGAIHNCMEEKLENHIEDPGVKVSELSEMVHSTKPATSKMLKALEEKGYIERISDKKDRRVVYIRLSSTGEKKIREAFVRMQDFAEHTINRLGEDDSRELVRILNKFCDAAYEEIAEWKEKSCKKADQKDMES